MKKQPGILTFILITAAAIFFMNNRTSEETGTSPKPDTLNPYLFPDPLQRSDWRAFENAKTGLSIIRHDMPSQYAYMEGLNRFVINER